MLTHGSYLANSYECKWFPTAYLPGASTFEIQMTSGEFNADLFAMANATTFQQKSFTHYETVNVDLAASTGAGSFTADIADITNVSINGTAVAVTKSGTAAPYTFSFTLAEAAGTTVEVTYAVETANVNVAQINNQDTATGDLLMRWPVYAAANDDVVSAIKGYYYRHVFKARVTQVPGFDTSYKQNTENSVTFSALDAGRSGGIVYEDAYIETATTSTSTAQAFDPANNGQGTKTLTDMNKVTASNG